MTTPTPPTRPPQVTSATPTNRSTPLSRSKLLAWGELMVELIIAQVAMALANVDVLGTHPFAFLAAWGQQLQQTASDAYVQSQAAQSTADNAQSTADTANTTANTSMSNWTDLLSNLGVPGVSQLGSFLKGLLGSNSPLDANNLFNLGNLLGKLPIGNLSAEPLELLDNPDFREAISVRGDGIWTYDDTDGKDVPGCASVEATSDLQRLMSNTWAVTEGDVHALSVWAKWAGLTYTDTLPIRLQIVELLYDSITQQFSTVGVVDIDGPTFPDAGQTEWKQLSGSYTTPANVSHNALQLWIGINTTGGRVKFDKGSAKKTGLIDQSSVSGLPEALQRWQLLLDTAVSALAKTPVVGAELNDLFQLLGLIPSDSVTGAAGAGTMKDSIFAIIDAYLGGAVGSPGATGGSLADVTNVTKELASGSALGKYAFQIVNTLNNTPVARGFLATGRANYDITSANTFLDSTQSACLSASFGLLQAMSIGVISWYGYGTSGITEAYINLRKVNLTTGVRTLVHHSANIVGILQPGSTSADADFMFYEIPTPLAAEATDYYYVEWVFVGGTHHIRGMSFSDAIKDHPVAAVPGVATTVDYSSSPNAPATTLPKATASPNDPWFEFAVSLGVVADPREPDTHTLTEDGEQIPIPNWANRVDLIPLGKGGKGHDGATLGFAGEPGSPGRFAPITLARDTDFTGSATVITFNVLTDGSAKLSIPGHDTTATPGEDGAGTKFGLTPVGLGPGVLTYNGQTYAGGVDQKAAGGPGTDPGGGGNGGNGLFFQPGGPGGKPCGWVCFRQVPVTGEVDTGDVTPPTPPTLITLDAATPSTLTVTITGGTD